MISYVYGLRYNESMKARIRLLVLLLIAVLVALYFYFHRPPKSLTLAGVVDGEELAVGSQITARVDQLNVDVGDRVQKGQVLALLSEPELEPSLLAATAGTRQARQSVNESEVQVRLLRATLAARVRQAQAQLRSQQANVQQQQANLERLQANYQRVAPLASQGIISAQQLDDARTNRDGAKAALDVAQRNLAGARAALQDARAQQQQVAMQTEHTAALRAAQMASAAQQQVAAARLGETRIVSPVSGIVSLRVARPGEVVTPGGAVVEVYNLNDTWIDAYVEETYSDLISLGDRVTVRLPSGQTIPGTVYYKSVEAGFATQRDVSRTKRDIRTVELRVRVNNADGRLARGMTAWVVVPLRTRAQQKAASAAGGHQ